MSDYSFQARQRVNGLSIVGASQLYPLILAALERFPRQEMEKLLHLLEAIAVRYQLIIRGRPGRIESLGGRAARDIWNNKITKTAEVRAALSELYVPDDDFKRRFLIHSEKNGKKARYILATLERQSLQRDATTYVDELIPGDVTLEHVLPKSPRDFWATEVEGDPKLAGMTNRIGNLCLLTDVNRALGNKGWPDKLEVFGKSRLRLTNTIAVEQFPQWKSAAIEKRQGYLSELAVAAWRYD